MNISNYLLDDKDTDILTKELIDVDKITCKKKGQPNNNQKGQYNNNQRRQSNNNQKGQYNNNQKEIFIEIKIDSLDYENENENENELDFIDDDFEYINDDGESSDIEK